jgi:hypothetical protein
LYYFLFRHEDSGECCREMDNMAEMGDMYYQESGNLFKLAGVFRAADIFWNPEKRQVFMKMVFSTLIADNPYKN